MAVHALTEILNGRHPLDDTFESLTRHDNYSNLESRDRAFARAIVMATLRHKGQLAEIIKHFIEKPLPEKRGRLDAILLCSAAQLVFLKSPPHAVINLAVFQVREDRNARRFAKLANAVLRRVSEQGTALALTQDAPRLNTPSWLFDRWIESYGPDIAERIARQHLNEPPLDLTVKSDPEGWAARLGGVVLPCGSVRLAAKGRIEELDGYAEGEWWVQDIAASFAAKFLGGVRGKSVADLCAAPGGKTAQLAHAGADVTALDISENRLKRLRQNLERLKLSAEIIAADLLQWEPDQQFDAILLDAPCSSTGTIRRHPDLPYLKKPSDIAPLVELQKAMLDKAIALLKPGGTLVYATCSLEPSEGPDHIDRLLAQRNDLALSEIEPDEIDGRAEWLVKGRLRTLPFYLQLSDPDLSGMDGFFAARLVKRQ
jgi:16S rRNA (cytosine967-C5)-methyltransferase